MTTPGFRGSNTGYEDDWTDIPSSGFWPKWFGGVFFPLALLGYGIACIVKQRGYLPGRHGGGLALTQENAIALGIACLAASLFLHCHFFWGNIYHLSGYAALGKVGSALVFIVAFGFLIVRIGALGLM